MSGVVALDSTRHGLLGEDAFGHDRNEAYHFEGSNSAHSGGHQHDVLELLGPTQPSDS